MRDGVGFSLDFPYVSAIYLVDTPLWEAERWSRVKGLVDEALVPLGTPSLKVMAQNPINKSDLKFGRLSWTKDSMNRWLHKVDGELLDGSPARFMSVAVSSPSHAAYSKANVAPLYFLTVASNVFYQKNRPSDCISVVHLALPEVFEKETDILCRFAECLDSRDFFSKVSPWWDANTFMQVDDFCVNEIRVGLELKDQIERLIGKGWRRFRCNAS